MNYSELPDPEVNKLVARILYPDDGTDFYKNVIEPLLTYPPDYCNSWADMGPIIEESRMILKPSISSPDELWSARTIHVPYTEDKNPLRAAAICFLMMKEGE